MQQGFNKIIATNPKQILFMTNPYAAVGITVSSDGVTASSDGKKIIKAGTPVSGDLEARGTAFKIASTTNVAKGVVLHDIDVTSGSNNAELLILGFVNLNNLDTDVQALITADVKTALKGIITFLK